jgi:hypothetical protein
LHAAGVVMMAVVTVNASHEAGHGDAAGGIQIVLQLGKGILRRSQVSGLEGLAERLKIAADGAGAEGVLRLIGEHLLQGRVGLACALEVSGLERAGELVEILPDLSSEARCLRLGWGQIGIECDR